MPTAFAEAAQMRDQVAGCIASPRALVNNSNALRRLGFRGSVSISISTSTGGYSSICRASGTATDSGSSTVR